MFASDCFEWPRRDGMFDVHEPAARGDRERSRVDLATEWGQLQCDRSNGDKSRAARWAPCCVVSVAIGGGRGRRILGRTPEPAQWSAMSDMVRGHRVVRGLPIELADANGDAGDRLA